MYEIKVYPSETAFMIHITRDCNLFMDSSYLITIYYKCRNFDLRGVV